MPNFLIIGAPKAGTSSLYAYLKQHPEIYMSPIKEPHFFMLENKEINFRGPGDKERFKFAVHRIEDYQKLFAGVKNEIAVGEASTTYLGSERAPERIKQYIPDVKLIAVLRNPVDAAYASFLHLLRDGDEFIDDFSMALQAEQERIQKNWGLIWHYQQRNFYYAQVKRYFEIFNKEQIKIYIYEEFKENPRSVLYEIFDFLGVDPSFKSDISSKHNVSAMPKSMMLNRILAKPNPIKDTTKLFFPSRIRSKLYDKIRVWNLNGFRKPNMLIRDRNYLRQVFQEDILNLQNLIKKDLSSWLA